MATKKGMQKQDGESLEDLLKEMAAQGAASINSGASFSINSNGLAVIGGPQYASSLSFDNLITKIYQSRKVIGDLNDKSKLEAIQCSRCNKWIPIIALLDDEAGITGISVLKCPIGRTGAGGVHLFDFGDLPANPSLTTTMMPAAQVEKYERTVAGSNTPSNPESLNGEPKNDSDTPVEPPLDPNEVLKNIKSLLEAKKQKDGGS